MTEIGSAFISIVPSTKGLGRKLSSQVGPEVDKSGKVAGRRFGDSFGGAAKVGLLAGGVAIAAFAKSSINSASDAQQSIGATETVFGGFAKRVIANSDAAATQFGLSANTYRESANLIGSLFKNQGVATDQLAGKTKQMIGIGADLAATFGGTTTTAVEALGSAFKGEYDSLEKYGISLKESTIAALLAKRGQDKLTGSSLAAAKQQAVTDLIMKQSKDSLGAFGKESNTLAGQQQRLGASFENVKATVGTALLPALTSAVDVLGTKVVPAVSDFVTGMRDGEGAGGEVASTLKDVYAAAKPVGVAVVGVVKAFASLPGSTQKVVLLAGAALLLKNRFEGVVPSLQNFDKTTALATAKTTALRGGALAAGAGLASLSANTADSDKGLSALTSTAAGAAVGFAVGGPWGAAIGGGAGLLASLTGGTDKAAAAQARLKISAKTVADTLNQQTGAMTKLTRATAAKTLADDGVFNAARKVGASYKDVLNASLGNEAATKRVTAATRSYIQSNSSSVKSTVAAAKTAGKLTSAVSGTTKELGAERNRIDQVNQAMARGKDKTVTYRVRTPGLVGAISGLAALGTQIQNAIDKANRAKNSIGSNAKGTDSWRGGLTVVGEKGPELINLARGAQVIPNHKLGDVGGPSIGGNGTVGGYTRLHPEDIAAIGDVILAGATEVSNGVVDSQASYMAQIDRMRR